MCHEPYRLGDELEATLEIPAQHPERRRADSLALQCRVEVVRTEVRGAKRGLACRIKQYFAI
jgi:hypothetical protein